MSGGLFGNTAVLGSHRSLPVSLPLCSSEYSQETPWLATSDFCGFTSLVCIGALVARSTHLLTWKKSTQNLGFGVHLRIDAPFRLLG